MKVGIIAEGKSDISVIRSVLKGSLGIDSSDTIALVPDLEYDETDKCKYAMSEDEYSNWTIVKKNCMNTSKISDFFKYIDDDRFLIIHIDTDTRFEKGYEVNEPKSLSTEKDCELLYCNISNKMIEWLSDCEYINKIKFAIAIQETDAWVLPIYKNIKQSDLVLDAKGKLFREINKDKIKGLKKKVFALDKDKLNQYTLLSKSLTKRKELLSISNNSYSLTQFIKLLEG